jgi:hypothetical protein
VAETGVTQIKAFQVLNEVVPTFDTYQAFKDFKRHHRHQLPPPDPISEEISALFEQLPAIDSRGSRYTTASPDPEDTDEVKRFVAVLEQQVLSDPAFRRKILTDYARLISANTSEDSTHH